MSPRNIFHLLTILAVITTATIFFRFEAMASDYPRFRTNGYNFRNASQLYSRYCRSCHGRDGRSQTKKGKFNHARDLTDAKWQDDVSDERLFNSIMNGRNVRGNMPGFNNKLNDIEADSLVEMVRKFRK